jgi:hypothetical protein
VPDVRLQFLPADRRPVPGREAAHRLRCELQFELRSGVCAVLWAHLPDKRSETASLLCSAFRGHSELLPCSGPHMRSGLSAGVRGEAGSLPGLGLPGAGQVHRLVSVSRAGYVRGRGPGEVRRSLLGAVCAVCAVLAMPAGSGPVPGTGANLRRGLCGDLSIDL